MLSVKRSDGLIVRQSVNIIDSQFKWHIKKKTLQAQGHMKYVALSLSGFYDITRGNLLSFKFLPVHDDFYHFITESIMHDNRHAICYHPIKCLRILK